MWYPTRQMMEGCLKQMRRKRPRNPIKFKVREYCLLTRGKGSIQIAGVLAEHSSDKHQLIDSMQQGRIKNYVAVFNKK